MPDDNEKSAVEEAIDKLNDLIEDAALTVADAAIDPQHLAPTTNAQVYIPEKTESAVTARVKGGKTDDGDTDQ